MALRRVGGLSVLMPKRFGASHFSSENFGRRVNVLIVKEDGSFLTRFGYYLHDVPCNILYVTVCLSC